MIKNKKLSVFQDFVVDKTLPKYKKIKTNELTSSFTIGGVIGGNFININDRIGETLEYEAFVKQTLLSKIKLWIYRKIFHGKEINKKEKVSLSDLKNFFDNIKNNVSELDNSNINEILNKYGSILSNAKYNNQIALCEKLEDYVEVLKYELILTTSEFKSFLDEDDIVNFHDIASKHEKYQTNLCLSYIKNFIKIIPEEISELKVKADALNVFDNYVILHYDYKDNSTEDTKAEKEKKKDPILFGIIKNSTRLYYIGDWIDEYCDLTLDVLIKKIGVDEKILNKETIFPN